MLAYQRVYNDVRPTVLRAAGRDTTIKQVCRPLCSSCVSDTAYESESTDWSAAAAAVMC